MTYYNIQPSQVYKINDINAHIILTKSVEMQRKSAFFYFNDNIYLGYNHAVIFDNIINLSSVQKETYIKYRFLRQKSLINIKDKISFGHVLNKDVVVIDSYTNLNCTDQMIMSCLIQNNYQIIYNSITSGVNIIDIYRIH